LSWIATWQVLRVLQQVPLPVQAPLPSCLEKLLLATLQAFVLAQQGQQVPLLVQELACQEAQPSCRQSLSDQPTLRWCLCHTMQSGQH
jgi:hypothetical protein